MFVKCNYMGWIWIRFSLLGIRNMFFFLQCIIHVDDHKRIRFSFSFPLRKILLQDMFIERLRIRVWFFGRIWILKNSDTVLVQAPRSKIPFKLTSLLVFIGKS